MSTSFRAFLSGIALVSAASFAVYPSVVQLDMTDAVTHRTFRSVSEEDGWRSRGAHRFRTSSSCSWRSP
jgi:hypothetical protein